MMCNHHLGALLSSLVLLGVVSPNAYGDDLFRDKVAPFMKTYCVRCHNQKTAEGLLNLTRYTSSTQMARDFRQWEHVITFLKEEKMPPEDARQPAAAERAGFLSAVEQLFLLEARKLADDPSGGLEQADASGGRDQGRMLKCSSLVEMKTVSAPTLSPNWMSEGLSPTTNPRLGSNPISIAACSIICVLGLRHEQPSSGTCGQK